MKNKKLGFTLIELLAVIIILTIIALIATPIILNVIEEAKISAGRSEANMILEGINNYCATENIKYQIDSNYTKICTSSIDSNDVKEMINLGNASIDKITYNGEKLIELTITSNNHRFTLCPSGTFAIDDEECPRNPKSLITKLLEQYNKENTVGLVKDSTKENKYYYKGKKEEVTNNYLWYGGHQWRVIEFDTEENTLMLITQSQLTILQPASTVWTTKEAYETNYINTWLNDYFLNSLESNIQSNILDNTFNIGVYNDIDEITTTQKVGLLDENQYNRAGNMNSYLDIKDYFWLGNRFDSSNLRHVYQSGYSDYNRVTSSYGVRPVIKISDIIIETGDGSLANSYRTKTQATNTSNVQVGEYINVPYEGEDNACGSDNICTFRVVSKDNDSIKIVLNGLLPNTSKFGESTLITKESTIYKKISQFAEGINTRYRYIGDKVFYVGDYPYVNGTGQNYEDIKDETLQSNVGLLAVGDMFSGNDIDLGSTKTFVDVNTIENPTVSNGYWVLNRYDKSVVRYVESTGGLSANTQYVEYGVRPVIFLKSGNSSINFTGGEGTAQSPYTLQ